MFDYVALTGDMSGRAIEYVDHLHEHFVAPVRIRSGRYVAPHEPGSGRLERLPPTHNRMRSASRQPFRFFSDTPRDPLGGRANELGDGAGRVLEQLAAR
jgi:hypothetical protein